MLIVLFLSQEVFRNAKYYDPGPTDTLMYCVLLFYPANTENSPDGLFLVFNAFC